jgi:hypothetical protein
VQVVVVGLHEPPFSGEVLRELARLQQVGIVRLIDVVLVHRAADGSFSTVELPADAPAGLGEVASAFLAWPGDGVPAGAASSGAGPAPAETWSLADVVPPGSTAAVAFLEHLWAAPLRTALERGGGTPLEESWLSAADLEVLDRVRQVTATG